MHLRQERLDRAIDLQQDRKTAWSSISRLEWFFLGGLLLFALTSRVAYLGHVPPGIRFDELVNVRIADHIYAGEWPIYFQEAWGHEPLYHYVQAASMALLGHNVVGVRAASAAFGVLGVLATYLAFRRLFGRTVATVAAVFLTASFWSLMYSRVGLRHISLPPWIGGSVYCFWRGLECPVGKKPSGILWFALGGLSMGAMLYTYFASRVVPAVFAAFVAYLGLFHRPLLRGRWLGVILFFAITTLAVTPMALYLRRNPELEQRLGQVGGEILAALQHGDFRPLVNAVVSTLKMFSLNGDPEWLYNISGRPVFDPATAIPFYGGVILALARWRRPEYGFVLLWLAIGIAPAMLSWPPGSLGHTIAAQPVAFLFPALALGWLWASTGGETRPQRDTSRWLQWGTRALAIAAATLFCVLNGYDYFARWPAQLQVRAEYQAPVAAVARYLERHPELGPASVSAPYVDYWNPWSKMSFDLLTKGRWSNVRWFDGSQSIIFPTEPNRPQNGASFFLPDYLSPPIQLDQNLQALFLSGARPVDLSYLAPNGSTFDLYLWQDADVLDERLEQVGFASAWTSPEGPYQRGTSEAQRQTIPFPLDFGHRLSLLGYSYEQAQVSPGEIWRLYTYWQVLDPKQDPLAIFVHLLDQANDVKAGWDGLYVSPESWGKGDIFIHAHTLQVPVDIKVGDQRVELGVYSPRTLERLALYIADGSETAPFDRVLFVPLQIR